MNKILISLTLAAIAAYLFAAFLNFNKDCQDKNGTVVRGLIGFECVEPAPIAAGGGTNFRRSQTRQDN